MAEPKIKTIQARFGFADPDLKKPAHDEMIKWLDANIEDILMLVFSLPSRPNGVRTKWEPLVRMTADGGQFIGFADLMAYRGDDERPFLFEAKTTIDSLGELFRQLRLYRAGFVNGWSVSQLQFVIVCPDETNASIIQDQGFRFLKYDPKTVFPAGGI
jgi:hypothetical protein